MSIHNICFCEQILNHLDTLLSGAKIYMYFQTSINQIINSVKYFSLFLYKKHTSGMSLSP